MTVEEHKKSDTACIVGIRTERQALEQAKQSAAELKALVEAAGAEVVDEVFCTVHTIQAGTYIGSGKVEEIRLRIMEQSISIVVLDVSLSPPQQRNLEKTWDVQVIDRTGIILDIFAQRAASREGRLQVELAQLDYRLPRLTRMWTHLSRLGAGIGTRGPGETQLEVDRRRIRTRILKLKTDLKDIEKRRDLQRENRRRSGVLSAALVGYTNAGKSTLLNLLTASDVIVKDQLFVTLDPTIRQLTLPDNQSVYLCDTVGFISRLPHQLVAAFHATLEEVVQADLLIHVINSASPQRDEQINDVESVLKQLGAGRTPVIRVYNKIDLIDEWEPGDIPGQSDSVAVSAQNNLGIDALLRKLMHFLMIRDTQTEVFIPYTKSAVIAVIRDKCRVLHENFEPGGVRLQIIGKRALLNKYREFVNQDFTQPAEDGTQSES
jgi:GTPase